ncbi:MAG TPA: FlhC family transcriptional regulator [Steroidobacteraceae bacterium]|nr:hypothetical protein [Steroidobacteraceae bacterium]HQW08665.1 FlhC family transcriptional regulator [Steroidobacteraceae bacterium]HQX46014.1 FlhC family transcriptional regulator [Steroidobacteraceae bacterium]HQX77810.1 FlhC family transcriptional regulator [Steroidobacteraceae bacterium]HQZ79878.1 FlhC family transcriptional regulator [Steroidobacteraceae bacterium]
MRITDDRYCRDRLRFDLALRLIGHEARTRTIRLWTGLTEDRVRKLYRTYIAEHPGSSVARRRGKSPQRCSYFLRSPRVQQEAAVLAGLLCMAGIVVRGWRLDPRALSIAQGELLCTAYETYLALVAEPRISFEHAAFLVIALTRGDELALRHCGECGALTLVDCCTLHAAACNVCAAAPRTAPPFASAARLRRARNLPAAARGTPAPAQLAPLPRRHELSS